ncbi:ion transporter [Saccharospirillum mangrovi]|uniref:ion transporter n=1 Tax=Saccharospirillum mangrovi TaxID=2161747 RepID=UPI000D3C9065|nr:ion transporter [Saccharospirillum mangrovi]
MSQRRPDRFHIARETDQPEPLAGWRLRLNDIIFGAESPAGKAFDIALIIAILISVMAVMLETVGTVQHQHGGWLVRLEWFFTLAFTLEYGLRLLCVRHPWRYATSFFGVVDLLSIIPTYLSLLIPGVNSLLVIRVLRILRVFRVLKLFRYLNEAEMLLQAMRTGYRKILVFLYAVLTLVIVFGSIMYLIEGPDNGFSSIPRSVYWAIVTLTTVGYGDIAPVTAIGQFIASAVMITGYAIIAVPTGIYTAELANQIRIKRDSRGCPGCGKTGHELDADFCRFCGESLQTGHD